MATQRLEVGLYRVLDAIAEGRFGTVHAAVQLASGQHVALKRVRGRKRMPGLEHDPWARSAERELKILTRIRHEHVVQLLDYHVAGGGALTLLVFELLSWDLATVLECRAQLAEAQAKVAMHMLLTGLSYLHRLEVMHRDIKPANLLVQHPSGILKIADFGSARFAHGSEMLPMLDGFEESSGCPGELLSTEAQAERDSGVLTREVCTRWYKSPEMLFGSVTYTKAVDLWAAGCVLGDLLAVDGQALFPGGTDIDQLCRIFRHTGAPDPRSWPEVQHLPDYGKIEFNSFCPKPWPFQESRSAAAVRLLEEFLQLNPDRRQSATDALHSAFLTEAPALADPSSLVSGLQPSKQRSAAQDSLESEQHPFKEGRLDQLDEDSEDSFPFHPGEEFERISLDIPLETTTCGLWGDFPDPDAAEPVTQRRVGTPPPPVNGHRFKQDAPKFRQPAAGGQHEFIS